MTEKKVRSGDEDDELLIPTDHDDKPRLTPVVTDCPSLPNIHPHVYKQLMPSPMALTGTFTGSKFKNIS